MGVVTGINGREIPDVPVYPRKLYIGAISGTLKGSNAATFKPLGYDVEITITGSALCDLIKWAIRKDVVILNGEMYYKYKDRIRDIVKDGR